MITNETKYTQEIKSMIATVKTAYNRKKALFTRKLELNLRKKLLKYFVWVKAVHSAETWELGKIDHKYVGNFEM
jgi:hypothetical protein